MHLRGFSRLSPLWFYGLIATSFHGMRFFSLPLHLPEAFSGFRLPSVRVPLGFLSKMLSLLLGLRLHLHV